MNKKTVKQFRDEFVNAFGELEYKAVSNDGMVFKSKGYQEQQTPRLEISAIDYERLGKCSLKNPPSPQAWGGLAKLVVIGK